MLLWVSAEEERREKEEEEEWLRWPGSMAIYSLDPTVVNKREKEKKNERFRSKNEKVIFRKSF